MRLIDADELTSERIRSWQKIIKKTIDDAPTIDANPIRHGRWKPYPDCGVTRCSACDWSIEEAWWSDYCPNCGAKMDEVSK